MTDGSLFSDYAVWWWPLTILISIAIDWCFQARRAYRRHVAEQRKGGTHG